MEGGFAGRTHKLVDGCYSLWQGGAFPLLAHLLAEQAGAAAAGGTAATGKGGPASQRHGSGDAEAAAAAARRVSRLLLGEAPATSDDGSGDDGGTGASELADWVAALPRVAPLAAAEARHEAARRALDAAVEASIDAEDRYKAAAGAAAAGPLQQEAVAALEAAAEAQRASESAAAHLEALRVGAATLLERSHAPAAAGEGAAPPPLPQLYEARALQLWLLACCQSVRACGAGGRVGEALCPGGSELLCQGVACWPPIVHRPARRRPSTDPPPPLPPARSCRGVGCVTSRASLPIIITPATA